MIFVQPENVQEGVPGFAAVLLLKQGLARDGLAPEVAEVKFDGLNGEIGGGGLQGVQGAWLHFGRDADGSDRSLLHAQPFCPLEIWPGSRGPVIATPPDTVSPLKVLRAP